MCLRTITVRYDEPQPEVREAWKLVRVNPRVSSPFRDTPLEVSRWMKADPREVHTEAHTPKTRTGYYMTGFHVFADEKQARKAAAYLGVGEEDRFGLFGSRQDRSDWKLIKVKVRGVTVEGIDGTSCSYEFSKMRIRNLVAQEMMIPVASLRDKCSRPKTR